MRLPIVTTTWASLSIPLLLWGCAGAPVRTPTVSSADVPRIEAAALSFLEFEVDADVEIPAGAPGRVAKEANYEVLVGDNLELLGSGKLTLDTALPAEGGIVNVKGNSPIATDEGLGKILMSEEPVSFIYRGSVLLEDGDVWEFSRAGRVRAPRTPQAIVYHVEASVQRGEIDLIFFVRLGNQNPFELEFEGLSFMLDIGGRKMIDQGRAGRRTVVPPSSNVEVRIEYELTSVNFPEIEQVINTKRRVEYLIDGVVELSIGQIPVELDGFFTL